MGSYLLLGMGAFGPTTRIDNRFVAEKNIHRETGADREVYPAKIAGWRRVGVHRRTGAVLYEGKCTIRQRGCQVEIQPWLDCLPNPVAK